MKNARGWLRFVGALLLGAPFVASAEIHWLDDFGDPSRTHYPTGEEACTTGVLQRKLDGYRATSTQPHQVSVINIGPDNGIGERVCRGVIERRASGFWVTVEVVDTLVYGPYGSAPACNLPGLADPETGQCGVPKCDDGCALAGGNGTNPIDSATGNKSQREVDYEGAGAFPLRFERTYNSHRTADVEARPMGVGWSHSYGAHFNPVYEPGGGLSIRMYRPSGAIQKFSYNGSVWTGDPDIPARFAAVVVDGFIESATYTTFDDTVETYNAEGRLLTITNRDGLKQTLSYATTSGTSAYVQKVTDPQGRALTFSYTAGQLTGLTDSSGMSIAFGYAGGDLVSTTYPVASGTAVRSYLYNEAGQTGGIPQPHLLTGIVDEGGQRHASWGYDAQRRGTLSVHGAYVGGTADRVSIAYNANGTSTITDMHGQARTYGFDVRHRVARIAQLDLPCDHCGNVAQARTYDANGYPDLTTGFRGSVTDEDYVARGLRTQRIDASNDSDGNRRVTQTDWHAVFRSPVERRVYDASGALVSRNNWTYNARGQVLTFTQTDPATSITRTTSTTYCEQSDVTDGTCPLVGLVKSVKGPRADMTTYAYYYSSDAPSCATAPATCPYRRGDLRRSVQAVNRITDILAYDGAGRPLSVMDSNGVTDFEYHPRGWLTAQKVRGADNASEADDRITRIEYWPTGLVRRVTNPDGAFTAYIYDAAQRLTDVTDNAGNAIHYVLDSAGNRVREDIRDAGGELKRTSTRIYNQLGRLQTLTDAGNNSTGFTYDMDGNPDTITDALGRVTDNDYDPLNRLARTLQDAGGVEAQTRIAYDAQDNPIQVIDPNGLQTTYVNNGFGERVQQVSPDTGATGYAYDAAGNLTSRTDARGVTRTYTYDAPNRLRLSRNPADVTDYVSYTWTTFEAPCEAGETFANGLLTRIQDGRGTITQYCYDRFGQVVRKRQTVLGKALTVRYAYTKAGALQAVTYPGGTQIDYVRNAVGQVTEVGVTPNGGSRQVLLNQATYYPFGPSAGWVYGNGRSLQRTYDLDYRPQAILDGASGGLDLGYGFDEAGNLETLTTALGAAPRLGFGYDTLDRLTQTRDGPTGTPIETYGYDATGNRTSFTNSAGTQAYVYPATSHRLASVGGIARSYDAAGNTTSIGGLAREFVYDSMGRMAQVRQGGAVVASYAYNGMGERVLKQAGAAGTYTIYDEAGRWLGDYNDAGVPIHQAIWLDDLPVGLLAGAGQQLRYIEPDPLGTPRAVISPLRNVAVWAWDARSEAFGNSPPHEDPDGDGLRFVFDMRFPGQRYDAASGLNYNYYRDGYDPGSGRYTQSDPIGLRGGISTYGYAVQSPLNAVDPSGLAAYLVPLPPGNQMPAGSIYCVDGVIRPYFNYDRWPKNFQECKEVRDCLAVHEWSHVADANRTSPGLCRKGPLSFLGLGNPPRSVTFPSDPYPGSPYSELDVSELRAHTVELYCLMAKLKNMTGQCDEKCKAAVIQRIRQITRGSLPAIREGTY